jgi:outer membrane lipoprotein carrier protein
MKKMVSALFLALATMLSVTANAQDAKAKSILDKLSAKIKSAKSISGSFQVKTVSGKQNINLSGSFALKGNKYFMKSSGQEIMCDGKNVWTFLKQANEVQVSTFNHKEQSLSPAQLLSGSYYKDYVCRYAGERTFNGKAASLIELTPRNANTQFKKLLMYVDKNNMILGGDFHDKNGSVYNYSISGVSFDKALSDQDFAFQTAKHPGVEVVDLR